MHKILILGEHLHPVHVGEDTLTIRFEEAVKVLPALRDGHFAECKVVMAKVFDPVQCRFLVHIPRVIKPQVNDAVRQGRLVLDCKELSGDCKAKVKELIDDLGLHIHANSEHGFVIGKQHPESFEVKPAEKLHIGFYQQQPNKPVKIDEDELLKDDIVEKKPKIEACITKPKACANCNCGRKEAEQKSQQEVVQEVNQGVVKSSCGNCYLGDAFRCATCPYKGLPAFKPGQKVSLNLTEEVAGEAQIGGVQVQSGKVTLEL